jgi:L-alanine-DL-glutamate epimerase-like enolase superfamily enzyme
MHIHTIRVFSYDLSYRFGTYVMSGGRAAATQTAHVVAITTDTGVTGWGEIATLGGTYLPAFAGGVREGLLEVAPVLLGHDPRNIIGAHALMDGVLLEQRAVKSAIDVALWDILGRVAGLPIAMLTGGVQQASFPLYEAVPLDTPENMVAFVNDRMQEGIASFQLKVGNEPEIDAERTRAVVDAVPEHVRVIADSNGGWDVHDALLAIRLIGDIPVYIEQPCRSLEDNILVSRKMPQQLILDECILGIEDLMRAKHEAGISAINIKLSRLGGLTNALQLRNAAISLGIKTSMEDTWGGDITTAAVSHMAATTKPSSLVNVSFFNDWTLEHVAGYEPRSQHGRGSAPVGPGLGITVDESLLTPVATFSRD